MMLTRKEYVAEQMRRRYETWKSIYDECKDKSSLSAQRIDSKMMELDELARDIGLKGFDV